MAYPIPTHPAPPSKPGRPGWVIPLIVGLVVLVLALGGVVVWALLRPTGSTPAAAPSPAKAALPTQVIETFAPTSYYTPKESDFILTVKVTKKKCFGSAGCNITYHVNLEYGGDPLDPSKTYRVTYEVSGVEDGPAINTLEVTGDQYTFDEEELGQTSTSTVKLKVKVTDVEEQ